MFFKEINNWSWDVLHSHGWRDKTLNIIVKDCGEQLPHQASWFSPTISLNTRLAPKITSCHKKKYTIFFFHFTYPSTLIAICWYIVSIKVEKEERGWCRRRLIHSFSRWMLSALGLRMGKSPPIMLILKGIYR